MSPVLQSPIMGPVIRFLLWALAIGSVVFVILQVLKSSRQGALFAGEDDPGVVYRAHDLRRTDYAQLILAAEADGRYRQAIRWRFLDALSELARLEIVDWRREKTNRDYLAEIKPSELRNAFAVIARLFDRTWYGDVPVDATQYANSVGAFATMTDRIGERSTSTQP